MNQAGNVFIFSVLMVISSLPVQAAPQYQTLREDKNQVRTWNQFASDLLKYHQLQIDNADTRVESRTGGYGGERNAPDFYREFSYFDSQTGKLLSRLQWETNNPENLHSIEVFTYNDQQRLVRDYHAAYLPRFRNAPIQTLVNLHAYNDELQSFRQFDASGDLIYEQCHGQFFGKPFMLSIEEHEFARYRQSTDPETSELYRQCFASLPVTASEWIRPLDNMKEGIESLTGEISDADIKQLIEQYNQALQHNPEDAMLYLKRADLYFMVNEFDSAIKDYNRALAINPQLDKAYFGLGMAKGRAGRLQEAISDLSIYLKKYPEDSHALTKRGVRYIWHGDLERAQQDLEKAIAIDSSNAEAHDDLGVVYAQNKQYDMAMQHFNAAIQHDPSYQKAHHNRAMVYLLQKNPSAALQSINQALLLSPEAKNSLLLKGEILIKLGKKKDAEKIFEQAEFLPDGNWSERSVLRP